MAETLESLERKAKRREKEINREKTVDDDEEEALENEAILIPITYKELDLLDLPERKKIMAPWLFEQSLNMLYAERGIGKSFFAIGVAMAVAKGGKYLKWKVDRPRRVLYIDGEMPQVSMQERLRMAYKLVGGDFPEEDYFLLLNGGSGEGYTQMPDISTKDGRDQIDRYIKEGKVELLILDNLATLDGSMGTDKESEAWSPIQKWLLKLRASGLTVLMVHHSGKSGSQLGTSRKEHVLDEIVELTRPENYDPEEGARFCVHFNKRRDLYGKDAQSFEAHLTKDFTGNFMWNITLIKETKKMTKNKIEHNYSSDIMSAFKMKREGRSLSDIAAALNVKPKRAEDLVKRGEEIHSSMQSEG